MMSVAPPGGNGTIIRTGLVGNACAVPTNSRKRRSLSIDLRNSPARHRIFGVKLPEVIARPLAALRRGAVRLEEIEPRPHIAGARRVEPQPHQTPPALGLRRAREPGAGLPER